MPIQFTIQDLMPYVCPLYVPLRFNLHNSISQPHRFPGGGWALRSRPLRLTIIRSNR